jgi:hypothetical protein
MSRNDRLSNQQLSNLNPNKGLDGQIIFLGEVVSIDDPLNSGRIKVRVQGAKIDQNKVNFCSDLDNKNGDNIRDYKVKLGETELGVTEKTRRGLNKENRKIKNELNNCDELPWSLPFLPLHMQIMPKVGEMVTVMFLNLDKKHLNRFWVSPLVPDKTNLSYQTDKLATTNFQTAQFNDPNAVSKTNTIELIKRGDFTGGFPEILDVSIQSRNNADIVMPTRGDKNSALNTGGEILLRAGKFKFRDELQVENKLELNDKNPGYIRLKVTDATGSKGPETHTIILSDYITIGSYVNGVEGGSPNSFPINPIMENDESIVSLHRRSSPMVRGDQLVEFLDLLKNYVIGHNHPYHKHPATNANSKNEIEKFDLNRLLSTNIRIN